MGLRERLASTARMKELMLRQFQAGWLARERGKMVAYVTSGAPVEMLRAVDVVPVYPENHGAVCGVARAGGSLCRAAEERGYRRDLCSYWRIDWGARTAPASSPIGGLPPPDFLVCANNICRTVVKWYEGLARFYRVPLILLDMPFRHEAEDPAARAYVRAQFRKLPDELARLAGTAWEDDRFREAAALSREASALWADCLAENAARPCPATAADHFILMGPVVTMRGTPEAVAFYRALLAELRGRASRGEGAVDNERVRLLWDNLPVWHQLKPVSAFLAARGAVLVGATYTHAWTERPGEAGDVLGALADAYARVWLNSGIPERERVIRSLVSSLSVDGIVFHSNRSCKPYSFGQQEIASRLKESGIPCIVMEADMADERDFAHGAWQTRLEAFLERIEENRGTKG